MAVRTKSTGRAVRPPRRLPTLPLPRFIRRYLPGWILLIALLVVLLPNILATGRRIEKSLHDMLAPAGAIAPLFTDEVRYWSSDIKRWADAYGLDPNLLATVMQIESCGHPSVSSYAGAQGLFQVMPFHFADGENQIDPETNAQRGASFLQQCLTNWGKNDPGLAMACYNGGPSLTNKPYTSWPNQTQRYYIWGMGIYTDASANQSQSPTLDLWLNAGGEVLCQQADHALGM